MASWILQKLAVILVINSGHEETGDIMSNNYEDEGESSLAPHVSPNNQFASLQRAAAIWILKVRENHLLPQCTIETIIKDTDTLYEVISYIHK